MPADAPYQAYFCEENVWQLAQHLGPADAYVVFVSNDTKTVAMWRQRTAIEAEQPVVWDYHVVLLKAENTQWKVYDRDSVLPTPCSLLMWLTQSFPTAVPPEFAPTFRVVDAQSFLRDFASDRSHMRSEQGWRAPPPSWPPIGTEMNLFDYVNTSAEGPGFCRTREELLEIAVLPPGPLNESPALD